MPEEILCFELLSSANISKSEKMFILSSINFDKKEDLFDHEKKSLKKFKSDIATGDNVSGSTAAVKLKPAFVTTTQEEALATSASLKQRGRSWFRSRGYRGPSNFKGLSIRPDLAYEVVKLSSNFDKAVVSDLIRANKNLLKLKQLKSFIRFPNLGPSKDWKIVVFSDASHANIDSVSSVGGHIVLIAGCKKRSAPIAWSSSKIKPVVRSTLAAETLSLSEAFDHAIYLKQIVMELTAVDGDSIPTEVFVDNQSGEDGLYSTKLVDEKRLELTLDLSSRC